MKKSTYFIVAAILLVLLVCVAFAYIDLTFDGLTKKYDDLGRKCEGLEDEVLIYEESTPTGESWRIDKLEERLDELSNTLYEVIDEQNDLVGKYEDSYWELLGKYEDLYWEYKDIEKKYQHLEYEMRKYEDLEREYQDLKNEIDDLKK
jgi:hypothetical protein